MKRYVGQMRGSAAGRSIEILHFRRAAQRAACTRKTGELRRPMMIRQFRQLNVVSSFERPKPDGGGKTHWRPCFRTFWCENIR